MVSTNLKDYLKTFNVFTEAEMDDFSDIAVPVTIRKSDYFIREGEVCNRVVFVLSGILRSYYISDKHNEITYCITFPNQLMTAYSSYLTSQPTHENIQAVATTQLLVFSKEKVEKLARHNMHWTFFLKTIAEQQYIELEKRIVQLQKSDATQRYVDLISNHPEYIQKIPLQYLASYLGISQRHLSRIRKDVSF